MSQQQPATGQSQNRSQSAQQPPTQQPQQGGAGGAQFPTRNCLPQDTRSESIQALNHVLADAVVLRAQCQSAHWNVKGLHFYQLHELFEDVADMLIDYVDEIAERITALGGLAQGTVPVAAQSTGLPQFPVSATDEWTVLESVANSLASFDATLQMQIESASSQGDLDTADLLNELSRDVSKSLWFVEAHLQGPGAGGGASQGMGQQMSQGVGQSVGGTAQQGDSQQGGSQQSGAQPYGQGQPQQAVGGQPQ